MSLQSINCMKRVLLRSFTRTNSYQRRHSSLDAKPKWNRVLDQAEEFMKYQCYSASANCLLNIKKDSNWTDHVNKLKESKHPILEVAKNKLTDGHANINQAWSLIVLLISRMAGYSSCTPQSDIDAKSQILKKQLILSEIVELTLTGLQIHSDGVVNIPRSREIENPINNEFEFGNLITILSGDALLSYMGLRVSALKNSEVHELFMTSFLDHAASHFVGKRDLQNNPLPTDPKTKAREHKKLSYEVAMDEIDNKKAFALNDINGTAEQEWKLRTTLSGSSLIGKSFQSALMLAKHSIEDQRNAYFLGKHFHLAYQASKDLELFSEPKLPAAKTFSLVSAPILFHIESDPTFYDEIEKSRDSTDFDKIYQLVRNGPGMEKTRKMLSENSLLATMLLYNFPDNDARSTVENLIAALEC